MPPASRSRKRKSQTDDESDSAPPPNKKAKLAEARARAKEWHKQQPRVPDTHSPDAAKAVAYKAKGMTPSKSKKASRKSTGSVAAPSPAISTASSRRRSTGVTLPAGQPVAFVASPPKKSSRTTKTVQSPPKTDTVPVPSRSKVKKEPKSSRRSTPPKKSPKKITKVEDVVSEEEEEEEEVKEEPETEAPAEDHSAVQVSVPQSQEPRLLHLTITEWVVLACVVAVLTVFLADPFQPTKSHLLPPYWPSCLVGNAPLTSCFFEGKIKKASVGMPCYQASNEFQRYDGPWMEHCRGMDFMDLLPCPPGSLCRGGAVVGCQDDIHFQVVEETGLCLPSSATNETIASMVALLTKWTLEYSCMPMGNPYAVQTVKTDLKYPTFLYTQVVGELETEYDLTLIQWMSEHDLIAMHLQEETGEILVALPSSHSVQIPFRCSVEQKLSALFLYVGEMLVSASWILVKLIARFTGKAIVSFWNDVSWVHKVTIVGGILLFMAMWQKRARDRDRRSLEVEVANTKNAAMIILQNEDKPQRVEAVKDAVLEALEANTPNGFDRKQREKFRKRVWPKAAVRLQSDARVQYFERNSAVYWKWDGPVSHRHNGN